MTDHEVIKHTAAIHISNTLTRTQRIASNVLLKNAYGELQTKNTHSIQINDLALAIGFDSNNTDVLKEALTVLNSTQLEWNILERDKKHKNEWGVSTILAHAKIKKGVCEYSYSPVMRDLLSSPNVYARLNLLVQRQFRSKHALAIWEYLVEQLCSNRFRSGFTEWLTVGDFKKMLGVQNDPYYSTGFKHIGQKLLKEPLKEINDVSDITSDVEYEREQRRVVRLRFRIARKDGYQVPLDLALPSAIVDEDEPDGDPLIKRLLSYGLTDSQARSILERHDQEYITGNLDAVEKNLKAGNIKNVPAYTLTAMKEDYRPRKKAPASERIKEPAKNKKESVERKAIFENLKTRFDGERFEKFLKSLGAEKTESLKTRFLKKSRAEKGGFVYRYYQENGFDNLVVKGAFHAFIKETLPAEIFPVSRFKAFMKSEGHKVGDFREELKGLN